MDASQAFKFGRDNSSVEEALNEDKGMALRAYVFTFREMNDGRVLVIRGETPYEARLRLQASHQVADSFHSSIPNNPEHSLRELAYDVAIGAGQSVDDVTFYAYLCRVRYWRLHWKVTDSGGYGGKDIEINIPDEAVERFCREEITISRELIDSTVMYRKAGCMLGLVTECHLPSLIANQTWGGAKIGKSIEFGGRV